MQRLAHAVQPLELEIFAIRRLRIDRGGGDRVVRGELRIERVSASSLFAQAT